MGTQHVIIGGVTHKEFHSCGQGVGKPRGQGRSPAQVRLELPPLSAKRNKGRVRLQEPRRRESPESSSPWAG